MGNWGSTGKPDTTLQLKKRPSDGDPDEELREPLTSHHDSPPHTGMSLRWTWWLTVALNTLLLLAGQTAATLLGRFYYDQGGGSKWMQTLTLSAAFPILYLPLLLLTPSPLPPPPAAADAAAPHLLKISVIYTALGLITAADSLMYSYGLLYLSVSTYSLVCATQLAFNAVFSYFINGDNFTHFTLNSLVLLTFSAVIIAVHSDTDASINTTHHYALGFALTLAASALYSLILSLMELTFQKVIKTRTFAAVYDMQIYTAAVSTAAAAAGLFASGEWRGLRAEMESFRSGRAAYVATLVITAVCWQVTNVGLVALIFEVSSLFSNVISTVGIPIVPVFAVVLFNDRMDGMKVMSLLLSIWGFVSYFYQHYLDYNEEKKAKMAAAEDLSAV